MIKSVGLEIFANHQRTIERSKEDLILLVITLIFNNYSANCLAVPKNR